ncbi:YheV family putative zinc ribbon protein [Photobacterium aphoticum]|uniref:Metal-binding protein n=1 Tax=Photobacterium aphoticum TaxID=754436 RepID=A0A090R0D2_9GAMM|nr:YheV family putative zinc ribbon protein [Photobacterium aphoticum]KLU98424.1 metal-binding protein [Photobacterium aphoticum]PSU45431.1 metal-binding protein [Photobacterium aphoticum]GAL08920.1 putative cytoplasmic protein [Photobacterium aphoticum]GHA44468.1 DNA-binding protein [Photobacterium aphoticum]
MAKKRFIAGAVCPSCQQQDTLRWWQENDVEHVECVACAHTDVRAPQSVEDSTQLSAQTKQQVIGIFKPQD